MVGDFDEEANRVAFQEALMEFRGGEKKVRFADDKSFTITGVRKVSRTAKSEGIQHDIKTPSTMTEEDDEKFRRKSYLNDQGERVFELGP